MIAETRGGDANNVVVVGAHLDSVPEGPGINDDGSGTATLLAQAEELARGHYKLRQKIRFAWWGAEENGLIGSSYYAENLSDDEVAKIDVMLDYDMLASPNYVRGIYDGDGDDPPEDPSVPNPPGPEGSGKVEDVFDSWFEAHGLESERGAFDGRSDYVGFTLRGIPAGGVFAGAEGVKTAEEETIYGGAAGAWYDPCYHQICDNLTTVLTGVPPINADGLAFYVDNATDADRQAARQKMAAGPCAACVSSEARPLTPSGTSRPPAIRSGRALACAPRAVALRGCRRGGPGSGGRGRCACAADPAAGLARSVDFVSVRLTESTNLRVSAPSAGPAPRRHAPASSRAAPSRRPASSPGCACSPSRTWR